MTQLKDLVDFMLSEESHFSLFHRPTLQQVAEQMKKLRNNGLKDLAQHMLERLWDIVVSFEEPVEQVLAMLQEFYEKAGTATALGQQHPTPPPTWEEAYLGMQSRSGGVIGMLQGILTDLTKLAADTETHEISLFASFFFISFVSSVFPLFFSLFFRFPFVSCCFPLFPIVYCCFLLFLAVSCCVLLFHVVCCFPLFPIVSRHVLLFPIVFLGAQG